MLYLILMNYFKNLFNHELAVKLDQKERKLKCQANINNNDISVNHSYKYHQESVFTLNLCIHREF